MKTKIENADNKKQGHSHAKHMWMMAVCCGLPIIGFLAIGILGISMPSLETLLLVICPISMVGMMYMMQRDSQGKEKGQSCCQSDKTEDESVANITHGSTENTQPDPAKLQQPGSFEDPMLISQAFSKVLQVRGAICLSAIQLLDQIKIDPDQYIQSVNGQ